MGSPARASGPCPRKPFAHRSRCNTRTVFAQIFVRVSKVVRYANDSSRPIRSLIRGFPGETAPDRRCAGCFSPPIRSCTERGAVRERLSRSFSFVYRRWCVTRTISRPRRRRRAGDGPLLGHETGEKAAPPHAAGAQLNDFRGRSRPRARVLKRTAKPGPPYKTARLPKKQTSRCNLPPQ